MAKRVSISTIGAAPPRGTPPLDEAADRMMAHWRAELAQVLPDKPDLIVVPEACDRFPEQPKEERLAYYRCRGNRMRDFFADVARQHDTYIAYSASRQVDDGSWRNSTQIIDRCGEVAGIYNKNHVVIEETTDYGILCGKDAPLIACDFGRVACAICFDLNFDELRLKYVAQRPDLIVFCSMYHGGLMQRYWAYSCRAHFVGAIAGRPSAIISPTGEILASSTNYFDHVTRTVNLDCCIAHLDYNEERLRKMKKKYGPEVTIADPGFLGSVLITSEHESVSALEMVAEFEIELLDDYWERALAHRHANIEL